MEHTIEPQFDGGLQSAELGFGGTFQRKRNMSEFHKPLLICARFLNSNQLKIINHQTQKSWFFVFVFISILHLISVGAEWDGIIRITKPMLISSLAIWYYLSIQDKSSQPFRFFLLGLCLSVLGDVLLMFVKPYGEHYFLMGLGAFLLAHLSYIISFVKFPRFSNGKVAKKRWLVIPFLLILITVLTFLWPYLGSFLFPVSIYSTVIISMALSSYNLYGRTKSGYSNSIFIGAVFFVLSDFTIAITKFVAHGSDSTISSLFIMSTYLLGQFLLCYGMKNALNEENKN